MSLWIVLSSLLMSPSLWAADAMSFQCRLLYPPSQQGEERYVKLGFLSSGGATLELADLASPYQPLHQKLKLLSAHYSHSSSSAHASWGDADGKPVAEIALVFLGSWWGAVLEIRQDLHLPSLRLRAGESSDLRCEEVR